MGYYNKPNGKSKPPLIFIKTEKFNRIAELKRFIKQSDPEEVDKYIEKHKICEECCECLICYDHSNCKEEL